MNPDEAAEKVRAKLAAAHEEATTLREQVERLTRERDEARRLLDQERARVADTERAAESGAVPVTPRPDVPSVEEVRRCLTRLSDGPIYSWDPRIDGVQETERTLRRLARACGLPEVG